MSNPKPLIDPTTVAATTTTYYTVPTNVTTTLTQFALHNTSASAVQVTVYLVPSGGSAGVTNQIFKQTIAALETKIVYGALNASLESAATIQAIADTASVVALHISGREVV